MGGRTIALAGVPGDPSTLYAASASGGLFRTENGGTTWTPLFTHQRVLSIGAVALARTDPEVIYVGTGENNPRNTASFGDGVYRSTDGGRSWTHLGLENTERISRIQVRPDDPDVVYVAALGHEWGPNRQRGVFRSRDGGRTWEKVLYVDPNTGASDLRMDSRDPDILYAGMWDYRRKPWHLRSGGSGSGLYRSADGGDTWVELTARAPENGLPAGTLGRIGISIARSNPYVVYAMIESEARGELWRSDDRGATWHVVDDDPDINDRPFYFSDIRVDPGDPRRVYALSGGLFVSDDGGRSFRRIGRSIHGDHQSMWIDPTDPRRLVNGSDGGIFISDDRGEHFEFRNNLAISQAYHVDVDMRDPYYVCGGLQDNGVWCGPSRKLNDSGIRNRDWYRIHGGDGYYAVPDPRDWTTVYANAHYGNIVRVDAASGEKQWIQPYPVALRGSAASRHPYRFNWNSPVYMSPTDPDVVYFGSNVLFRTTDRGRSWKAISPDLTRDIPEEQRSSGGPITTDNTSAEYHNTIIAISQSPMDADVIWVGTDDGNLQVTRNGGESWSNVVDHVPDVPDETWIPAVDASDHETGTAYVVFDRHRQDDFTPRVYRTDDYGRTWTDISANLEAPNYPHVIKDDPRNPDVLYLGTELGGFVSFDRGKRWVSLRRSLPPVAWRDLTIHPRDNDLVIATHGRGYWILDDATPLQQLTEARDDGVHLFDPPRATRFEPHNDYIDTGDGKFVGQNSPVGAPISYYLAPGRNRAVHVEILDDQDSVMRHLEATDEPGINRIVWDLREDPVGGARRTEESGGFFRSVRAPRVVPGTYTVRLSADHETHSAPQEVRLDPRLNGVRPEDVRVQHDAVRRLATMAARARTAVRRIDDLRDSLTVRHQQTSDPALSSRIDSVDARLTHVRIRLATEPGGYRSPTKLQGQIETLLRAVDAFTGPPTEPQREWTKRFDEQLTAVKEELAKVVSTHVEALDRHLEDAGLAPAVSTAGTP